MTTCLVMFSGGLDSTIAVHLLTSQGIEVTALHFVLPFQSGLGLSHNRVSQQAAALRIPIRIEEEGAEFLAMIKNPSFGYGKNANPCIDCRINRLIQAKAIMEQTGAAFIATGEVIGQRPMSQRRECLGAIEKRSGLKGLLLRPLCAGLLKPTIPEETGLVDRSRLLSISGRGRKEQIAYAARFGLQYPGPAGGCILTHAATAARFDELMRNDPAFSLNDFQLIAYGRHFRINPDYRIIIGRNESENETLERLIMPGDQRFVMADSLGPVAIGRGNGDDASVTLAASLTARYSKEHGNQTARVKIGSGKEERIEIVKPAEDALCQSLRVGEG